ncbi:hypothetical protein J6590_013132 [Homalodisca vitripennis]|nr:hypothetical protein J6590_013132 [Homalodisca vitripennis]
MPRRSLRVSCLKSTSIWREIRQTKHLENKELDLLVQLRELQWMDGDIHQSCRSSVKWSAHSFSVWKETARCLQLIAPDVMSNPSTFMSHDVLNQLSITRYTVETTQLKDVARW